jgi:hypothetical protein
LLHGAIYAHLFVLRGPVLSVRSFLRLTLALDTVYRQGSLEVTPAHAEGELAGDLIHIKTRELEFQFGMLILQGFTSAPSTSGKSAGATIFIKISLKIAKLQIQ